MIKNRDFLLLWLSQICSQSAERIFLFVVILITYLHTHSNLGTTVPALGFGIPAVLFGSMAGVYVDRHNKRQILMKVNYIRACLMLIVLFVFPFFARSLWAIFAGSFAMSFFSQLFIPGETTLIARVVTDRDLVKANSIFIGTFFGIGVVVFALASRFSDLVSVETMFLAGAVALILSAAALRSMSYQEAPRLVNPDISAWWIEYRDGLEYAWSNRKLRLTLLSSLLITTIFSAITVMGISFTDQVLHWPAEKFGYLALIGGAGMFLGMVFVSRINETYPLTQLMRWGFFLAGAGLLVFAWLPLLPVRLLGLALSGYGSAFVFVPIQTLLQSGTPAALQARVLALQNMILNFSLTLPIFLLGKAADHLGVANIFGALGVLALTLFVLGQLRLWWRKTGVVVA